jgi:hypothetical protein
MKKSLYAALVPATALAFWAGSKVGAGSPADLQRVEDPLVIGDTLPNAIVHDYGRAEKLRALAVSGETVIIVASAGCKSMPGRDDSLESTRPSEPSGQLPRAGLRVAAR